MLELEALGELARNGNARIYIRFDKHTALQGSDQGEDAIAGGRRASQYAGG
jgi:RNA binding exosome subunit